MPIGDEVDNNAGGCAAMPRSRIAQAQMLAMREWRIEEARLGVARTA
jgi:hypothetical protein